MPITFQAAFWIWRNHTSAATILGLPAAGGQAHIAFGRCEPEIQQFFDGTSIQKIGDQWSFRVVRYGDIPRWQLAFYVNPPTLQRPRECRIPSQSLVSSRAYPLWRRVVTAIPRGSLPRHLILFLRDSANRFHARVITANHLHHLPAPLQRAIISSHGRTQTQHVWVRRGIFHDLVCPSPRPAPAPAEIIPSGSNVGAGRSRPRPATAPDWRRLSRLLGPVGRIAQPRATHRIRRVLQRRSVRDLVLRCFGARCQARGCEFTSALPEQIRDCVLHVHHVRELGRGGEDSPYNLSVLCANHHALCHRAPAVRSIFNPHNDNILITYRGGSFLIERALQPLRELM